MSGLFCLSCILGHLGGLNVLTFKGSIKIVTFWGFTCHKGRRHNYNVNNVSSYVAGNTMMKLITIKEVSEMLNVKPSTLYEWVRNNTIPSYRLNGLIRFDTKELYVWIKSSNTNNTKERRSHKRTSKNNNLDRLITNAIETVNVKGYNSSQRETRQDQAHKKGGP